MVAPDTFQLLVDLSEGTIDEYTPDVTDKGLSYPRAEQTVDGDARTTLDMLTERGLLYTKFEGKSYCCPSCDVAGLQYTTVCPFCESPYAAEEELLECQECQTKRPHGEFYHESDPVCPDCNTHLNEENTAESMGYICYDCNECATTPDHRLWCKSCETILLLENSTERVLYRYGLTSDGEEWIKSQQLARDTVREALESRGFETRTDEQIEVNGATDRVHVFAEDPLFDRAIIVDVHEEATLGDVEWLRDASDDKRALLVTTSGSVTEQVAALARDHEIEILSMSKDGDLRREFDVTESTTQPTLFQRLTSTVS